MKLINADRVVHWQSYDDEFETFQDHEGTIAEFLDTMTDEGCPGSVSILPSALSARHGRWRNGICDQCGGHAPFWAMATTYYQSNFCQNCGADMRVTDMTDKILCKIKDRINQEIEELKVNGEKHSDDVRQNGLFIAEGLRMALRIIWEVEKENDEETKKNNSLVGNRNE